VGDSRTPGGMTERLFWTSDQGIEDKSRGCVAGETGLLSVPLLRLLYIWSAENSSVEPRLTETLDVVANFLECFCSESCRATSQSLDLELSAVQGLGLLLRLHDHNPKCNAGPQF
jgi:hypothetical protein